MKGNEMETKEKTLAEYIDEIGLQVAIKPCNMPATAPKWAKLSHNAYRVTLKYQDRKMSHYFYAGALVKDLKPADIVADLAKNWDTCIYNLQDFGDEFGWNSETFKTYKAVQRLGRRYADLIGDSDIRCELGELASEY